MEMNFQNNSVIIFDGMKNNVYQWMDNFAFIARRVGMNPDFLCNMRFFQFT